MSIQLITCPFCHTAFHPMNGMQMAQCPQCHSQFPNTHAQPLDLASLMARKQALEADRVKTQQKLAQVRNQFCQRNGLTPEALDKGPDVGMTIIAVFSVVIGSLALYYVLPRLTVLMFLPLIIMLLGVVMVLSNTIQKSKLKNGWLRAQYPHQNRIHQLQQQIQVLSQQIQHLEANNPLLPLT